MRKYLFSAALALAVAAGTVPTVMAPQAAYASEIKYIVNDVPITSFDIQHRAAFLKLQHRKGSASDEMIEQTLKLAEMNRVGVRISDQQVADAYARFAASNKLDTKKMDQILAQSGVTSGHFKEYIRTQMGWNQVLSRRFRSEQGGGTSEQQAVRRMLEKGGAKPTATEYMLQQVIFVVPASERGKIMGRRKQEANAMRQRFNGCDNTRQFAKGLIDVTVRDLGRVLAPQLPPEWADQIKATRAGNATTVRETERGVEFIGICSAREVSDDKVAQLTFQAENATGASGDKQAEELSKKYIGELRSKARIVQR